MDQNTFAPLPWLPVLETGYAEIDRQHRELIEDANQVQQAAARQGDWAALADMIANMQHDCALHFAEEEKLLLESGFPDATAHALEHRRILDQVAQIRRIVGDAGQPTPYHWELAMTLRSLLIDHLLRYDLRYKSHVMYNRAFGD